MRGEKKSESKIVIRREKKEEYREVENLTREAFWNVYRPGCMEHYVLHCYRDDPAFVHELDLVMEKDGELIGQERLRLPEISISMGSPGLFRQRQRESGIPMIRKRSISLLKS